MSDKNKKDCLGDLMKRLQNMENSIDLLMECVEKLKNNCDGPEEECPDELAADQAAAKAIEGICLDALFDVEPKGDA
mgnify:FL=1|tara:strand:+ start:2875 stop:3105 length:231 start_codon:yes stop_codon:yes gene_type:complete